MIRLLLVLLMLAGPASAQVPRAAEQYRLAVISSAASTFGPAAPVAMLSTSPEREDTILVQDPFQD